MNEDLEADILNQWRMDLPLVIRGEDPYKFPRHLELSEEPPIAAVKKYPREEAFRACKRVGISFEELTSHRRPKHIAEKKAAVIMWLIHSYPRLSLAYLGRVLAKDHTTLMHHQKKHSTRLEQPGYAEAWDKVRGL